MTKQELYTYIAAVLTTLAEVDAPESHIYLLVGSDMERYEYLMHVLRGMDWIVSKNHLVHITASGRQIASELNQVIGK